MCRATLSFTKQDTFAGDAGDRLFGTRLRSYWPLAFCIQPRAVVLFDSAKRSQASRQRQPMWLATTAPRVSEERGVAVLWTGWVST